MSRYDRQLQLAEVGALGQTRLGQLVLLTPTECSDKEAQFAALYAERCGIKLAGELTEAAAPSEKAQQLKVTYPARIATHFRHESSAALGVGAAVALSNVVAALFDQP